MGQFRKMLVHQYWKVDDNVFMKNLREGLDDFRNFVNEIRNIIKEEVSEQKVKE